MESRILKTLAVLGVAGGARRALYPLLRQFGSSFSTIAPTASAGIAVLFLLIVGGITFYTFYRWAPSKPIETKVEIERYRSAITAQADH
jgi:hypothetical protein